MGAGQVIERGLGLHDYVARHYAQPLGRWIAPDTIVPEPSNPQSLNRYSYVLGNPLKYRDPTGRAEVQEESGAALALRKAVEQGAMIYRQGRFGVQETDLAQFWAPINPLSVEGYAEMFGTAGTNQLDWVMGATLRTGTNFITRSAPALGNNPGGALEMVIEAGAAILRFFHMP